MNGTAYVKKETRDRVEQVMKENNYQPTSHAITLSRKGLKTIGVIIPEIANSFFGEIMQGITEKAQALGYSLVYCDSANNMEIEEKGIKMMEMQRVSGIIITPATGQLRQGTYKKLSDMIEHLNVPIVVVDRELKILSGTVSIMNTFNQPTLPQVNL